MAMRSNAAARQSGWSCVGAFPFLRQQSGLEAFQVCVDGEHCAGVAWKAPPPTKPNAAVVFEANGGLLLLLKLLLLECVVAALFMRSWVARVGGMMTAALARGKT